MTVQVTLVPMEPAWMALIVTVVSAHQDSQVMLFLLGGPSYSPITLGKGHLKENYVPNVSYFIFSWKVRSFFCASLAQFYAYMPFLNCNMKFFIN